MALTNCPKCGAEIQASIKVYLDEVLIGSDGLVGGFKLNTVPYADTESAIKSLVENAEGDELSIYCKNDHVYNQATGKWGTN